MRSRSLVLVSTLVLLLPALAVDVGAEDPHNRDCEGLVIVILLCAGADAGTNGGCGGDNTQAEVSCWYTYGWNLNASSPPQLPGGGRLNWSYEVHYCIDGTDCVSLEAGGGETECAWTVNEVQPCAESHFGEGALDVVLSLGECVVVTATVSVWSAAWSPNEASPLLSAYVEDESVGGGAACFLDNGRD